MCGFSANCPGHYLVALFAYLILVLSLAAPLRTFDNDRQGSGEGKSTSCSLELLGIPEQIDPFAHVFSTVRVLLVNQFDPHITPPKLYLNGLPWKRAFSASIYQTPRGTVYDTQVPVTAGNLQLGSPGAQSILSVEYACSDGSVSRQELKTRRPLLEHQPERSLSPGSMPGTVSLDAANSGSVGAFPEIQSLVSGSSSQACPIPELMVVAPYIYTDSDDMEANYNAATRRGEDFKIFVKWAIDSYLNGAIVGHGLAPFKIENLVVKTPGFKKETWGGIFGDLPEWLTVAAELPSGIIQTNIDEGHYDQAVAFTNSEYGENTSRLVVFIADKLSNPALPQEFTTEGFTVPSLGSIAFQFKYDSQLKRYIGTPYSFTHELGHVLGLDHVYTEHSLMCAFKPPEYTLSCQQYTILDKAQAFAMHAHLCGEGDLTFRAKYGHSFKNLDWDGNENGGCMSGAVRGKDGALEPEWCETNSNNGQGAKCYDYFSTSAFVKLDPVAKCNPACGCMIPENSNGSGGAGKKDPDDEPDGPTTGGDNCKQKVVTGPGVPQGQSLQCGGSCLDPNQTCQMVGGDCQCANHCGNGKVELELGENCEMPGAPVCVDYEDGIAGATVYLCGSDCRCPQRVLGGGSHGPTDHGHGASGSSSAGAMGSLEANDYLSEAAGIQNSPYWQ